MGVRERVLTAMQELVVAGDPAPPLDAIAARAGVSKGGLLHHFRDRRALATGLVLQVLAEADEVMTTAAGRGRAGATWLHMSAFDEQQRAASQALLTLLRLAGSAELDLPPEVGRSVQRWQQMIADELGDPVRAEVVRLVGDGLFMESLMGQPPTAARVAALEAHLLGTAPR